MESSAFLVTEATSPDIQLSSLSGNQTWVPLLYMFSAMAVVKDDLFNLQFAQPSVPPATWMPCARSEAREDAPPSLEQIPPNPTKVSHRAQFSLRGALLFYSEATVNYHGPEYVSL